MKIIYEIIKTILMAFKAVGVASLATIVGALTGIEICEYFEKQGMLNEYTYSLAFAVPFTIIACLLLGLIHFRKRQTVFKQDENLRKEERL